MNKQAKLAARAYAKEHGVSYTEALRITTTERKKDEEAMAMMESNGGPAGRP